MGDGLGYSPKAESRVDLSRRRAEHRSAQMRLPLPEAPEGELSFPENIGKLSDDSLLHQMGYWAALVGYAQYQVAVFDSASTGAEALYEETFALKYRSSPDSSVTDKRHHSEADSAVRSAKAAYTQLRGDAKVLSALFKGYEQKYYALSRELTRRKSDAGQGYG